MTGTGNPRGRLHALLVLLLTVAAAAAAAGVVTPAASSQPGTAGAETVAGELVVGFAREATPAQERSAVRRSGGRIEERLPGIDAAVVSVDPDEAANVAGELAGRAAVDYAEPNFVLRAFRAPNDPAFGAQWPLSNDGRDGGKPGADVRALAAWDLATGGAVTVAIVDTGIAYDHPDLVANVWTNPSETVNGRDDDGDGFVDDLHGANITRPGTGPYDDAGHGTHVAGIAAAGGNNLIGTAGVAWKAKLMAVKFLDAEGNGSTAAAAAAIDYAVRHGARVINASWGGPAFSNALHDAVARAGSAGAIVVAAAGNDGSNAETWPDYPAAFDLPNVISVGSSDRSDRLSTFSKYGARSVDLVAPGEDVLSTFPEGLQRSGYAMFSGTSMAAPFVTGAAALYLARRPDATGAEARAAVLGGVDRLRVLERVTVTGGRLNVARTLGAQASESGPEADRGAPTAFALLRPRNRHSSRLRAVRFLWQRARDPGGIRLYRLYVNGRHVRSVPDRDGPGGKDPRPRAWIRLRGGRHRWFVRAYDYSGNRRTSRTFRASGTRTSRVLYIRRGRRA